LNPYVAIIIGVIISTLIYIASGFIDIYWFSPHRRKQEENQQKKNIINYVINELELNHQKINNFIALLVRIDIYESQNRVPFNLNLEIKEKYEIYTPNFENLFFSNIKFTEELKKELFNVNNKLLEYKNMLFVVGLFATQNYVGFEEKFWETTRNLRTNTAVLWLKDLEKITEFINKLKNIEIK
jgi:hypothetical protein